MKLRKINRGLILTLLIVLGVAVYLVTLEVSHSKDRDALNNICAKYLPVYAESVKLSEADCALDKTGFEKRLETLKENAKSQQLSWFSDETCFEPTLSQLETVYKTQNSCKNPISRMEFAIKSVGSFKFDGNSATAAVKYEVSYSGPDSIYAYNYYNGGGTIERDNELITTTISFRKTGGEWKIYYFDGQIFGM